MIDIRLFLPILDKPPRAEKANYVIWLRNDLKCHTYNFIFTYCIQKMKANSCMRPAYNNLLYNWGLFFTLNESPL